MKKDILNKLIFFLIIYLPIGWMTHLGQSIIPLPLLMKFTIFFLISPFLFHQLLELLQAFLFNIWFNWKVPCRKQSFYLFDPREIFGYRTRSWVCKSDFHLLPLSLKQFPFSMTQLSSVCLKTYSPSNSVAKPRQHRQQDPKTHKSSMDLGLHLSQYGASFILYQIPNLCTCHPCLVLVPNK